MGSAPAGNARWGHADLAGSMAEWTLDFYSATWYSDPAASGSDVANLTTAEYKVRRDTGWRASGASWLRAAARGGGIIDDVSGMRCARAAAP